MINKEIDEKTAKRYKTIINIVYFAIFFVLSVLFVRYALFPLLPFVIALIVTLILNPLAKLISHKLKLDRRAVSAVLVLLFYATIGVLCVFLGIKIIGWISSAVTRIPDLYNYRIVPMLNTAIAKIELFISKYNPDAKLDLVDMLGSAVKNILPEITSWSTGVAKNIALSGSNLLIKTVVTVISTAFLLMDFDVICSFVHRQLPEKTSALVSEAAKHLGFVIKKYIVSYALIMLITFLEIEIGLFIIGIKNALTISVAVAVFDILPIVGSGMVLFPWAVIEIIVGNIGTGIGLLILWAVVVLIRQVMEPKIVGDSVGMHPFLTLLAMLAGNLVYGGIGILLLPVTLALCQNLNQSGIVHLYNPAEEEAGEPADQGRLTGFLRRKTDRAFDAAGGFVKKQKRKLFKSGRKKTTDPGKNNNCGGTDNSAEKDEKDGNDNG